MQVLVLGGTNFIGRAIVEALVAAGHHPLVCHRGEHEPEGWLPDVPHLHVDRAELASEGRALDAFGVNAVVDCLAMTEASAIAAHAALPSGIRNVTLSSQDVYRAFGALQHGTVTDAVPIDETSPTRPDTHPYPDQMPDYSKLEVEAVVCGNGGVALRLPMVFGPFDYQRREEPILRRVRAGRTRIPVGSMCGTLPMGFVHDIARGVVAAVVTPGIEGEIFNLVESPTPTVGLWAQAVLDAAGHEAELVPVKEEHLPPDLGLFGTITQPIVVSSAKARAMLGYTDTPWADALRQSVEWHLAHPPAGEDPGFAADDEALATAADTAE